MSDVHQMFDSLSAATGRVSQNAFTVPSAEGEGASEDGTVSAKVAGGKLVELRIDAHTMRRGNAEVADLVVAAVNAAIEAHATALMSSLQASNTDFGKLRGELAQIGEQAQRSMESHLEAMRQMLDEATDRASR